MSGVLGVGAIATERHGKTLMGTATCALRQIAVIERSILVKPASLANVPKIWAVRVE
jgi:hypothetical protein